MLIYNETPMEVHVTSTWIPNEFILINAITMNIKWIHNDRTFKVLPDFLLILHVLWRLAYIKNQIEYVYTHIFIHIFTHTYIPKIFIPTNYFISKYPFKKKHPIHTPHTHNLICAKCLCHIYKIAYWILTNTDLYYERKQICRLCGF